MDLTKFTLAKVNIGLLANNYLLQSKRTNDPERKRKMLDAYSDLMLVMDVLNEQDRELSVLNKYSSDLFVALLKTEKELNEKTLRFNDLLDSI